MAKLPPPRPSASSNDFTDFVERTNSIWTEGSEGDVLTTAASNELEWVAYGTMPTAEIGTSPNYLAVGADGTLSLHGTATAWEDLRVEPTVKDSGAATGKPAFEKWYDDTDGTSKGVFLYSFTDESVAANEKEMYFTMQMPHAWAGTAISFHVHWVGSHDDTTATPRWGLEYIWCDIGTVYGNTTIVYGTGASTGAGTDTDITAHKHYLTEFADITPGTGADGLSSIMIGRIFRNSTDDADTYNVSNNKCGLLYIDCHYEVDSFGSAEEYSKAPTS